jgi:hypothetical protein
MMVYVGISAGAVRWFCDSAAAHYLGSKAAAVLSWFYTKTGMGDGQQANNPWLQESFLIPSRECLGILCVTVAWMLLKCLTKLLQRWSERKLCQITTADGLVR